MDTEHLRHHGKARRVGLSVSGPYFDGQRGNVYALREGLDVVSDRLTPDEVEDEISKQRRALRSGMVRLLTWKRSR